MSNENKRRELTDAELDHVSGGGLTTQNPGGKQHGASQSTITSGNESAPPGQNKNLPPGLR
jgi:hypothetical protein